MIFAAANPLTPQVIFQLGPVAITDTVLVTLGVSLVLVVAVAIAMHTRAGREVLEVIYAMLEKAVADMVSVDTSALVPLVITQWVFIVALNLVGLVPGVASPTADLATAAALAVIAFGAAHVIAFRTHGLRYLKHYLQPNPILLPFNLIGELTRTLSLGLRLFGNMISGQLIVAILVLLAGLLVPVPLMLLSVLTSVVQAYIFGVLTLVFTASALQVVDSRSDAKKTPTPPPPPTATPATPQTTATPQTGGAS